LKVITRFEETITSVAPFNGLSMLIIGAETSAVVKFQYVVEEIPAKSLPSPSSNAVASIKI